MLNTLLAPLAHFVTYIISTLGYPGVALAMAIESACIPLPSEIIMPFSGFLVSTGTFTLLGVTIAGTIGGLIGSLAAYALGHWGGEGAVRDVIRKYGKYVFIKEKEFDHSIVWFDKYGSTITFTSRLLPVIRTFISLPAGIAHMPIVPFIVYTTLGSAIWTLLLGYLGMVLGSNWHTLGNYFHGLDLAIVGVAATAVAFYLYKKHQEATHKLVHRLLQVLRLR